MSGSCEDPSSPNVDTHLLAALGRHLGVEPDALSVLTYRPGRIVCAARTPLGAVVAKISGIARDFDREALAMRDLASLGLPVSPVLSTTPGPPAILIAGWAAGEPVSTSSSPATLAAIGALLARIHRIPSAGPFSGHPTIEAWICTWLRELTSWWALRDDAPSDVVERTDRWLSDIRPILASRIGTLSLFDGRPEHFIVDDQGTIRMIDVADLMPGDPAMDLALFEMHAPGTMGHLLNGYNSQPSARAALTQVAPFYAYLRHLAGAEWQLRTSGNTASAEWHLDRARTMLDRRAFGS